MKRLTLLLAVLFFLPMGMAQATVVNTEHCDETHRLPDDPIVFPNQPGASHRHVFFGNTLTDAFGLHLDTAQTTCTTPSTDMSGYWVPEVYVDGAAVPLRVAAYWKDDGYNGIVLPPQGLQFVTPRAWGTTAAFACTFGNATYTYPVDCGAFTTSRSGSGRLKFRVSFPSCWDGTGTEPSDLVYGANSTIQKAGPCPAGFTHRIPRLVLQVDMPNTITDGTAHVISTSAGDYTQMHGDWFNAMPASEMTSIVAKLNA